jgi:PAS domain S-box-containing protein
MPQPIRILHLEDSQDDARLVLRELIRAGFCPDCKRVETEADFVSQLAQEPDLILADYQLPQFDALRALRLVQELGADLPFIVVTGALGDEAAVECLKQGAADFLLKDRLARLAQAVNHALAEKNARAEQRRTEGALRESEARKTAILDTAADGILTTDERGIIESLNAAAEHIFGYPARDVIGRHIDALLISSPDGQHDQDAASEPAQANGTTTASCREVVGRKSDGTTFPMELSLSTVDLGSRRIVTRIVRDITERKQSALELERRAHDLARSNVELEQFAYIASHDLQEPLRVITGFSQLLARRYRGQLDATADEFISLIADGAVRMQTLINDLLAYSRVGRSGKSLEPVDLTDVFDRAVANLRSSIDDSGASVTRGPLPSVCADASQLTQLFQNLIGNAIKYRGSAPPRIEVAAERRGQEWIFSVRDNGIGFDPKYAERIFIIFQRLHTRDEYPGSGMGLAICKKIIERHGGRIWTESEPGRGACFFFAIPATGDHKP